MNIKVIMKNFIISILIGVILGAITEFALIFNAKWLINITQSFWFWGIIMIIAALCSKKYIFSMLNPIIIMTFMNGVYYLIRFFKSGYTNIGAWSFYTFIGIFGSIYLGTLVNCLKEKCKNGKIENKIPKYSLSMMTICMFLSIPILPRIYIFNNFLYYPAIGIAMGMVLGILIGHYLNKQQSKGESYDRKREDVT